MHGFFRDCQILVGSGKFPKVMIVFQDFMQVRFKPCITSILIVDASSLFVQRNSCEGMQNHNDKQVGVNRNFSRPI